MKAAVLSNFGTPDVFEIKDIEKPKIEPDQILVKVKVAGINPIDWKQRKGNHKLILGSPFPIILGYDICGEVAEIGSDISKFKVGDLVFGVLDNKYGGAYAEFAIGHEKCFAIKPENISNEEAAAYPMVSVTALQALRDVASLKKDQNIIINGASGGVGHVVVQLAKLMGARVIAVSSTESREFVDQYKPDEFIDYKKDNILEFKEKVDVFFDVFGNYNFPKTKHLLKAGGIYLNLNYINSILKTPMNYFHQAFSKGKRAKTLLMKHNSDDLNMIKNWIEEGRLKINIDRVFGIGQISDAHEYSQQGHNKGKNVVVISK